MNSLKHFKDFLIQIHCWITLEVKPEIVLSYFPTNWESWED